jgi:hypothetical protein
MHMRPVLVLALAVITAARLYVTRTATPTPCEVLELQPQNVTSSSDVFHAFHLRRSSSAATSIAQNTLPTFPSVSALELARDALLLEIKVKAEGQPLITCERFPEWQVQKFGFHSFGTLLKAAVHKVVDAFRGTSDCICYLFFPLFCCFAHLRLVFALAVL